MTTTVEYRDPFDLIATRVAQHLYTSAPATLAAQPQHPAFPAQQAENIDTVLSSPSKSYRDALLIQLAYRLVAENAIDLTLRQPGARTVAQKLGDFLRQQHVPAVKDALQNVGKNTKNLARGNLLAFDSFLRWASTHGGSTEVEIESAFDYACAAVAASARPLLPMPRLDLGSLTFGRVTTLLRELLDVTSHGAHEQFTVAALLYALVEQTGAPNQRVETKSLNASDKSSRAAGDVQIMMGNRVVEAYEISANNWESKLSDTTKTIRDHDLSRIHIVAATQGSTIPEILQTLRRQTVDVSVLDLWGFVTSLTSALTRPFRAKALERLYEYLDRYQPDIERVNRYVRLLASHELKE